jgi:pantoate--beta-alanine ligase
VREGLADAGFAPVDYVELVDAESLEPLAVRVRHTGVARLVAAAWLGGTRLIDNVPVAFAS